MIRAVIFDMDGLMFDTERLGRIAWEAVGTRMGLEGMRAVYAKAMGTTKDANRTLLLSTYGADFPFDTFHNESSAWMMDIIAREGIPVKAGLLPLLDHLKEHGYKCAVATSTARSKARAWLTETGVAPYFDAIVCGDMITHSKPAPDIYLKACELLGEAPEACLALEDSFNGIRSAHAGGLKAVMIPDLLAPTPEITALLYAEKESLMDIIDLLEEECTRISTNG